MKRATCHTLAALGVSQIVEKVRSHKGRGSLHLPLVAPLSCSHVTDLQISQIPCASEPCPRGSCALSMRSLLLLLACGSAAAFQLSLVARPASARAVRHASVACQEEEPTAADIVLSSDDVIDGTTTKMTKAQVEEVGNLAADDEWLGLAMELGIVMRCAIRESIKENVREFTGSDDYKVGDLSKEADERIKAAVAELRGKEEYELGDLSKAIDQIAKDEVCKMTGKDEYSAGDLSVEVDKRVKSAVADFCGKEEYEAGDLSREIGTRVEASVLEFTGSDDYEFGDISREIERRRAAWVVNFVGKQDYEFGDITKTMIRNFTGNDNYERTPRATHAALARAARLAPPVPRASEVCERPSCCARLRLHSGRPDQDGDQELHREGRVPGRARPGRGRREAREGCLLLAVSPSRMCELAHANPRSSAISRRRSDSRSLATSSRRKSSSGFAHVHRCQVVVVVVAMGTEARLGPRAGCRGGISGV